MKKIFTIIGVLMILLLVSSCSTKPEDACDCIKKAANDFMVQGVEIKSLDDLRAPCAKKLDKFTADAKARALIESVGKEVLENLKTKTLCKIDGEKLPAFPSYTFNNLNEFNEAIKKDGDYKYLKTTITIKEVYFGGYLTQDLFQIENDTTYHFNGISNQNYNGVNEPGLNYIHILVNIKNKIDKSNFNNSLDLHHQTNFLIYDTKNKIFIDNNKGDVWFESLIEKYIDGDAYTFNTYANEDIAKFAQEDNYKTYNDDLKNGRYLFFNSDGINKLRTADFKKEKLCLTKGSIKGTYLKEYSMGTILIDEFTDLKKLDYPQLLKQPGTKIDLSDRSHFKNKQNHYVNDLQY